MSKNIWHKPSETTDVDNNLIIDDWTNGTYELGYFDDNDMIFRNFRNDDIHDEESMIRWCDIDELIDDYDRTRKALDVAVDALKDIDKTRSVANHKIGTQDKTLNSGIVFCWTTIDEIHNVLEQITALEQKEE